MVFEEEEDTEVVMKEGSGVMVTEEHEEMISNFVETRGLQGKRSKGRKSASREERN